MRILYAHVFTDSIYILSHILLRPSYSVVAVSELFTSIVGRTSDSPFNRSPPASRIYETPNKI